MCHLFLNAFYLWWLMKDTEGEIERGWWKWCLSSQPSSIFSGNIPSVCKRDQKHLWRHSLLLSVPCKDQQGPLFIMRWVMWVTKAGILFPQSFLCRRSSNGHYSLWLCKICWNQSYVICFAEGSANPGQPHSCLDHGWRLGNWKPDPEGIPNTD